MLLAIGGPEQGLVYAVHGETVRIGRDGSAELNIDDDGVSELHASIVHNAAVSYVEDLGSESGTFVNEERVECRRRLVDGDYLRLGNTILRYSVTDELEETALTALFERTVKDPLTNVYNRRYFDEHLARELATARRHHVPVSVLLADIDHFKRVNDEFGHRVGDAVLQVVSTSITRVLRQDEYLARYGGEEFIVVARDTDARNAEILAERIRQRVEKLPIEVQHRAVQLTISVGIVTVPPEAGAVEPGAVVEIVDLALYEAKRNGRNRVEHSRAPAASARVTARASVSPTSPSPSCEPRPRIAERTRAARP